MSVRFSILWLILLGGVIYDVVVTSLGWFPNRDLTERLLGDFDIAWFIFSAWILVKLVNLSAHRDERASSQSVVSDKS